jgi:hypothetical protein
MPDIATQAKVTVAVLHGRLAIVDFEHWDPREDDALPQEIGLAFKTYRFDTPEEAVAFRQGVDEAVGWQEVLHLSPEQADAIAEALAAAENRPGM